MLPYAIGFEVAIWLVGLVLLGRLVFGQLRVPPAALPSWPVPVEGLAVATLLIISGGLLMPYVPAHLSESLLGPAARDTQWWTVVQGFAFQLGLLSGVFLSSLYLRWQFRRAPEIPIIPVDGAPALSPPTRHPLLAGTVTFLIALPLIGGIGFGWKTLVEALGYPVDEQDMVDLFRNADDPLLIILMVVLAAIIAPITEELIFRAGLFRYLRTRIPHWLALTLPALVFALLHGNLVAFVPLFALGVFFALAYERTGRIAVPMIAHALFNLHTLLLVMAGVAS